MISYVHPVKVTRWFTTRWNFWTLAKYSYPSPKKVFTFPNRSKFLHPRHDLVTLAKIFTATTLSLKFSLIQHSSRNNFVHEKRTVFLKNIQFFEEIFNPTTLSPKCYDPRPNNLTLAQNSATRKSTEILTNICCFLKKSSILPHSRSKSVKPSLILNIDPKSSLEF